MWLPSTSAQLRPAGRGLLPLQRSLGCLTAGAGRGEFGAVAVPAGRSQDGLEFASAEPRADGDLDEFERISQVG